MAEDIKIKLLSSHSDIQHEQSIGITVNRYQRCQTVPSRSVPLGPISASTLTPKSLSVEMPPNFRWVGLVLAIYLGIGAICFYMVEDQIGGQKTNGLIDSLYFCIVTMTTVGYGDLVPNSTVVKLLSCAFVFSGMGVVGFILSKAADYLVEKQEKLVIKALYGSGKPGNAGILGKAKMNRAKLKFIATAVILLFLIAIGTVFLFKIEKLNFVDAFYCVCSTITTLGYGDKSFSTKGGRVFAILWILTGTICLAQFLLYLAEMQTENKQQEVADMVLKRRLTFFDLEAADLDDDGAVGAAEFVVYKLKEMGKISQDDIASVLEQFKVLDVDQSGTLTKTDLLAAQSPRR